MIKMFEFIFLFLFNFPFFQLLKNYFSDVDKLVEDLAKQIWYICSRALEAVQGNNDNAIQQLVSAIRIIEREERFV